MSIELENVLSAITASSEAKVSKSGQGYRLQCPAHRGKKQSLYIADGDKKLIIKCHSHQCDPKEILESVGLSLKDIYYDSGLSGQAKMDYHKASADRQIKKSLAHELVILSMWVGDCAAGTFPASDKDSERVKQAWKRVISAGEHYSRGAAL